MAEIKNKDVVATNETAQEVVPTTTESALVAEKDSLIKKASRTVSKGFAFGKKHWKKAAAIAGAAGAGVAGYAIGKKFGVTNEILNTVEVTLSKEDILDAAAALTDDIVDTTADEIIDTIDETVVESSNIVEDVMTELLG